MNPLTIGAFRVERVVESEGPAFAPEFLFPEATPEAMEAAAPLLAPGMLDPGTGRLIMSFHSYVIRANGKIILVDTCVGNDKERPRRPNWHRQKSPFLRRLTGAGIDPAAVDMVLCTHLHADHVGWNTRLENGHWVPTFPNATYLFAKRELAHWQAQQETRPEDPPNHGSYTDSVLPVLEAGQARLVPGDETLAEGLWLASAPGHTPGNVVLHLDSEGARGVMCGDVVHHPVQLAHPEWNSRFCDDPVRAAATRRGLLEAIADTSAWLLPAHFPESTAGQVLREGGAYGFRFHGQG